MGGGGYFVGTPYSEKKYAKIKARRLVSGLLTVNVVHHSDNEATTYDSVGNPTNGFDDANEEFYNNWTGDTPAEKLTMKEAPPFNLIQSANAGRARYSHSFGDYDCLLYWVVGGMTLHEVIFTGSAQTQAQLNTLGLVNHPSALSTTWNDSVTGSYDGNAYVDSENWYTGITHPCQHFFKTHLIGRMNNAYGNQKAEQYLPSGILSNTWELNDNTYQSRKITNNSIIAGTAVDDHLVPPGIATDDASVLAGYSTVREGLWQRSVLSNGVFSNDDDGDFKVDLSTASNNTYFAPVESVEVYGKHQFTIPTRTEGGATVYSNGNTNAGGGTNYAHTADYFDMVVKINYASYDSDSSGASLTSVADKEFFKTRTNVFFQPFGETASFSFSDSVHTS
jgi:hypothetical protein